MSKIGRRAFLGAGAAAAGGIAIAAASSASGEAPSLAGKSILITGTSSGFGRLGAIHYAKLGATVIASMRNLQGGKRAEAVALKEEAAKAGVKLSIIEIDVTSEAQVNAGVAEAERLAGGALDALVNNAGIAIAGPIEVQDSEAALAMFQTNVIGPLRLARAALPAMRKKKGGVVFNVTSQLGRLILPNYGLYSSTKFALEAQSEQLAYELAMHGVEVCIIQPGGYGTLIWKNSAAMTDSLIERIDAERADAYKMLLATARRENTGWDTDAMDVPRAIAEILAMPPGKRPLRRAVHPRNRPQEAINAVSAETQRRIFAGSPLASVINGVLD
jgi:NAD(P)-dependent dehydrogenase (short-subunit alcohol dehydrogenase family)